MGETAILVEKLSKRYRLGVSEPYKALRDRLTDVGRLPLRIAAALVRGNATDADTVAPVGSFWALKDISFDVQQGEVIGVIGRNGAGKSTLLKILSRITKPTEGYAEIHGRVGSLLEVGTGFHPELSGRENIYLNGTILGMRRREIAHRFDEIVDFAEIEKFIDTPVKHYSSGMYTRLAFAVAAHLEPEILLIDEVLAVGDAAFQKKCLGKIGHVAKQGRTVFFVSHNMAAIVGLCPRTILLESGQIIGDGATGSIVEQYMETIDKVANLPLGARTDRKGNQRLTFTAFELRDSAGLVSPGASSGQDITLAFAYRSRSGQPLRNVHVAIGVHGQFDESLFHLSTTVNGFDFEEIPAVGVIQCTIPNLPLQPGSYGFNLFCTVSGEIVDWIQNAGRIDVEAGDFFGTGRLPSADQGPFLVGHAWDVVSAETNALLVATS
jgi:lipopolysaccharide transport system ATP-binding protein